MVSRGLIAADPSLLPLGTRVRLEHPGYSGEYMVADTNGVIRGRRIDIWIPTSNEAMKFGRKTVKLTVLSDPEHSPVIVRERLEKLRQDNAISDSDYQTQYANWEKLTEEAVTASAQYYSKHQGEYDSATYMPAKFAASDPNEKTFQDTYNERFLLAMDMTRDLITQPEYDRKLSAIVAEENLIVNRGAHSPSAIARYYQYTAAIPALVAAFKPARWTVDRLVTLIALLLGIALPFYLGYKKDRRERNTLDLERRKLELAERGSLFQVEEMKLKIVQLEEQLENSGKRIIIP
jgi:hypothetical protein